MVFSESDLKVDQKFDNECTVMIWRTSTTRLGLGGLDHPGHASVLLRKSPSKGPFLGSDYDPSKARYVSFWPEGDSDKDTTVGDYFSLRNGNFLKHHTIDYWNELGGGARRMLANGSAPRQGQIMVSANEYGQLPDVFISLRALTPNARRMLGLHINKIVAWCIEFKKSPEFNYKYISTSKNCSGVAVRALSAGGADAFAAVGGCSRKSSIYYTPNDAEDWANSVAVGLQKVNDWLIALDNKKSSESPWKSNLPTVDEWKTASHKSLSFRGSETRGVDEALAVWHGNSDGWDVPDRLAKGFGALVSVIQHTHMHMHKDPNSARNGAYKDLAQSILLIVERLALSSAHAWKEDNYYVYRKVRPGDRRNIRRGA
jgi:hypothetical protein